MIIGNSWESESVGRLPHIKSMPIFSSSREDVFCKRLQALLSPVWRNCWHSLLALKWLRDISYWNPKHNSFRQNKDSCNFYNKKWINTHNKEKLCRWTKTFKIFYLKHIRYHEMVTNLIYGKINSFLVPVIKKSIIHFNDQVLWGIRQTMVPFTFPYFQ